MKPQNTIRRFFETKLKKINAPYKLTVINEETMNESLSFSLTKKSVYIFLASIFVFIFLLFSALIFFTPLRYYVPGNSNNNRKELFKLQNLSDSLVKINQSREVYIYNLIKIIQGDKNMSFDTTLLSEGEIKSAMANNESKIDKASRYEYLKNQKIDSTLVNKKDSILHSKNK